MFSIFLWLLIGSVAWSFSPINVSPLQLEFKLKQGETDFSIVTITYDTTMPGDINWSVAKCSMNDTSLTLLESGGPDAYGYYWKDSNDLYGPHYQWLDITSTGTLLSDMNGDDILSDPITLPFSFNFYGNSFTSLRVCSNGWISFSSVSVSYNNTTLPNTEAPLNLIAPFWDDFILTSAGKIYYQSDTNRFIITFEDIPLFQDTTRHYTFQAVLYRCGKILFQYKDMPSSAVRATIGIQNDSGSQGLQIACNQDYVASNMAILIEKDFSWLNVAPTGGTLSPGAFSVVTVNIDAADLPVGDTTAYLIVETNDTAIAPVYLPLHLTVTQGDPLLSVTPKTVDFGYQYSGETAIGPVLMIKNIGYSVLTVAAASPSLPFYTTNIPVTELSRNQYLECSTFFIPTEYGAASSVLHIYESNSSGSTTVACPLSGIGIAYPQMDVSPGSISITLKEGEFAYSELTIRNLAGNAGPMGYHIVEQAVYENSPALKTKKTGSPVRPSDYKPFTVNKDSKYVKDELIVKYTRGLANASRLAIEDAIGVKSVKYLQLIDAYRVKITSGKSLKEVLSACAKIKDKIEYAEPNYIVHACAIPNDSFFPNGLLWGMDTIHASAAWDISTGNSNIIIGVIDTGVAYTHNDLAANIWHNPGEIPFNGIDDDGNGYVDDTVGWDFCNSDNNPTDDSFHGTHVAGTIAGVGNNGLGVTGVMWKAQIMPLKFLNSSGNGNTADAIEALQYAIKNGACITNNSWGGAGYTASLYAAISAANDAQQLFVASAGNDSINNDVSHHYPSDYNLPNVISVAATNTTDNLADFSNYGAFVVDLAAPGTMILSTVPGNSYATCNGSSMAAPHVTGACGLVWSKDTAQNYLDVRNAVLNGVDDLASLEGKCVTGGRLNVDNAMNKKGVFWLTAYPLTDVVPINGYSVVSVKISAENLTAGVVSARLIISDEVAKESPVIIPVELTVIPGAPQLEISNDLFSFGAAYVNNALSTTLRIKNTGYGQLTVTNIASNGCLIYSGAASLILGRTDYSELTVGFDVATTGTLSGSLTFNTNDVNHPDITITATALGLNYPKWLSSPDNPSAVLHSDGTGYSYLTIQNNLTGFVGNLEWHLIESATPDNPNYSYRDSDALGGPLFQWIDISSTGTEITDLGDESNIGPLAIGFEFPFYGSAYHTFQFCSNGYISLSQDSDSAWENIAIPSPQAPALLIAPFWSDLDFRYTGKAYYQSDTDKLVITWEDVPFYTGSINTVMTNTFQAILYKSGNILFQYARMADSSKSATIGIQDTTGTRGLLVAYNTTYVKDNQAVLIQQGVNWLSLTPINGVIAPGNYAVVTCQFNSLDFLDCSTTAYIIGSSNDPDNPEPVIPVTMTVDNTITPEFSGIPASGTTPLEVQFTDASQGYVTSWAWDFGDGGTSSNRNPVHTYQSPTTAHFTVTLIVQNPYSPATTITKQGYITVEPAPLHMLHKLPDIKILKGQALNNAFALDDYSDWKGATWGWWSDSGENQVNPEILAGLNMVSYLTTSNPDFTGVETIRYSIPSWNAEGTTNHVKYSDYLLNKLPYALVDDGVGVANASLPMANYIQPSLPASWPETQIRYSLASDSGKLQAVISNDTLQVSSQSALNGPADIVVTVSGSTSTSWDKEILRVYELQNLYGHFTTSSDTSSWAFEPVTDKGTTYSIARESWLPEYSGATGVLCLSFSSTEGRIKMTPALSNWAHPTASQWYTARMRMMVDSPDTPVIPYVFLFDGLIDSGLKISGRAVMSAPTTWQWIETNFYNESTVGVYPQVVAVKDVSGNAGNLYIDEIQMYPAPAPIKFAIGKTQIDNSKADWDSIGDTTGWSFEMADGVALADYTEENGQFKAVFSGDQPESLKMTEKVGEGVTNTAFLQAGAAAGFRATISLDGVLEDNLSMVALYGTDIEGGTLIKDISATALINRLPLYQYLETFLSSDYSYIYGQVILKNSGTTNVFLDDLYKQKDSDLPNYWDSSLF
jgi:subtilisin family serine protease/PKD repeat protein